MRSFEFSEEELGNLDQIGAKLFSDTNDPRSIAYVRVLKRPKIHWFRISVCVLVPLLSAVGAVFGLIALGVSTPISICIASAALLIYAAFMTKSAVICAVRIYQRYAPDAVRNKCRFEPSCSEYMILSIEKYGLFRGVRKGHHRLKRCNIDDGGFDMP